MISLAYALGLAGGLRLTVSEGPGAQPDACRGSEGAAPHAADLAGAQFVTTLWRCVIAMRGP